MTHFQNLRLKQHKGLKEASLLGLGKINVLCGPNNSGKTTVLECIANPKLLAFGKILDAGAINRIDAKSMEGKHWREQRFMDVYPQLLSEAASRQPIWFSDESTTFWSALVTVWRAKFPGTNPGEQSDLTTAFQSELSLAPKVLLIPAKRKLETSKQVEAYDQIRPNGAGILNFLFAAKNQDESSRSRKHFDEISGAFSEISGGFEFNVFVQIKIQNPNPSITNVELKFRQRGSAWIQADDCGLGLEELLIFLYFAMASEHEVVLIEEPENHIHPEIQRRLIAFLRETSEKQFFLSTHSSVFLNTQFADRVFTCRMTDSVRVDNATSRAAVLTELGYSISDNLVSDLVVLCEGPKDKPVLEEFFHKMGFTELSNIKVWPLGGDIMDQLDLTVFQETHRLIALVDGDPGSTVVRERFVKKCEASKIPITRLERYSIENYFSLGAVAAVMKGQMPNGITALDPKKPVSEQLGFEVKKNGGRIAKEMKLEDIKGTDFEAFLQQVAALVTK